MRSLVSLALGSLLAAGCSLNFDVFSGSVDGSVPDASDGSQGQLDAGPSPDAGGDAEATDSGSPDALADSGGPDGPCPVVCNQQCAPSCAACNGGSDFVTCMVCADGGPPVLVCGPADPNGFCLDGNYAHCGCMTDSDCPANNIRCSNGQCTSCGEQAFDQAHTRCNTTGRCCKSGATLGQCTC